MTIRVLAVLAALAISVAGFGAAIAMGGGPHHTPPTTGGGHDPVTVCHKPGTPAEQTLTFDDDGYKAHLAHGDTRGPCGPDETETTPTETTPTETTPTTPTPTTPTDTTPTPPRVCPDGQPPIQGEGAYDPNDDCKRPPPPVTTTTTTTTTTATTPTSTTPAVTPPAVTPPTVTIGQPDSSSKPPAAKPPATPKPDAPPKPDKRLSTPECPSPAYMLDGKCVRDWKGKPHPVSRGNG